MMDVYTATEQAYKHGYVKGYEAGKPKWIPVTERLPNYFGDFIVAVKEGTGNRYSDYASYDPYQQKWRTGCMLGRMDEVTHWMPLPEPPKERE
jgi:hypothetical protein